MHDADEELMQALDADDGTRSPTEILAMVHRARFHGTGLVEDGWGCLWMDLCVCLPVPADRVTLARILHEKSFAKELFEALCARPPTADDCSNFLWAWGPHEGLPHFLDFSPGQRLEFFGLAPTSVLEAFVAADAACAASAVPLPDAVQTARAHIMAAVGNQLALRA
jgi:hypothetical protein